MTSITFFDGVNAVGGNKILLEFQENSLFLDFGTNYKRMADFYEEFLKPRSTRGIHDFIVMGLIPPLDIYRKDLIPKDFNYPLRPKDIKAVFLSHAHLDHAGAIGLLNETIPLVASPTTAIILKAMRDCGSAGVEAEIFYCTPRQPSKTDSRVIEAIDYRKAPFKARDFYLTEEYDECLEGFLSTCPGSRGFEPGVVKKAGKEDFSFDFKAYRVDHSIYGATAYAIETPEGWVVYTGDFRMHGRYKEYTEEFVKEASKLEPKVLIIEGTKASGNKESGSEEEVYRACLGVVEEEKDLVVADFSPRNFERLDTFARIAEKCGRELVVLPKDAYLLDAITLVDSVKRKEALLIYNELKGRLDSWDKKIRETHEERMVDPKEISASPDRYILCFSFWDMKHLLDIKPEGGTYIYSSSEAHSEEQVIDFQRLWNWIRYFDMKVKGFEIRELNGGVDLTFQEGYHASGHASGDELIKLVKEIDPEIVIPIHTENPGFFLDNLEEYDVMVPKEDETIKL
jgi:ribonuclease J